MGETIRVGLDIGITNAKAAACDAAGRILATCGCGSGDSGASAEAIAARAAAACGREPADIAEISLTGIRANETEGTILGRPTRRVNEYAAVGMGGLVLSGLERAVVASVGTGSVFVLAGGGEFRHLGGTGLGGGTLSGMCRHLFGLETFRDIVEASRTGDISRVDLRVGDVVDNAYINLARDLTCSNFGKVGDGGPVRTGDFVLGVINMILETVGVMAVMACARAGMGGGPVVLTGALAELPQAASVFAAFRAHMGVEWTIADKPMYATAVGAVRYGEPAPAVPAD